VLEHDPLAEPRPHAAMDDAVLRRLDAADTHRLEVQARLLDLHADRAVDAAHDLEATMSALQDPSVALVVRPRLPLDVPGRRRGAPSLLVRDDAVGGWRPVAIHNHFVTNVGSGAQRTATLAELFPQDAGTTEGVRLRKGGAWRRDLLRLAHHHRMLESLGVAAGGPPVAGIIDRSSLVFWMPLDAQLDARGSALAQYDARFAERVSLLEATVARAEDPTLPLPGSPWWHKECEECPFEATCRGSLDLTDDVSLVRFTDATEQEILRDHGITTRRQLASLDLELVARGIATSDEPSDPSTPVATALGRRIRDLDRLVRRARVEVAGTMLRLVGADALDGCRADVEIDIDMESYGHATYLWGALVTARVATPGIEEGYRAFVEWGPLTDEAEGSIFASFFEWLASTVQLALDEGRTVRVYCFWAHAERGQMRRALASGVEGLPPRAAVDALLGESAATLADLHRVVSTQIQTAGPAGLKVLATAAGFSWRDEAPSGEASMGWYEEAVGGDEGLEAAARRRLLEYNEDDCRATRALRDWLEGPARELPDVEGARPSPT
jgi:predicted RecB family nuclease